MKSYYFSFSLKNPNFRPLPVKNLQRLYIPATPPNIKNIIRKENIEKFVVGLPKNNINNLFSVEKEIKLFIKKIKQEYPFLSIFRVDERFTSTLAKLTIAKSNLKKTKRENKKLIDKISATLILQSYLKKLL